MVDPTNGSAVYTYDAVGNILSVVRKAASSIVVAEVSPSRGAAGTQVTIAGTGFGTASNTTVSFNGTAAPVTSVTSTQIVVSVPSGAKTGAVSVTSPAGTAASAASFTVLTGAAPTVASFSPAQADQGATLTISGSGFDPVAANDKVRINGRFTNVTAATATSLKVAVPVATTGPISVTTSQGSGTSTANVVVPPLPYLSSQIGSVSNGSIGQPATVNVNTAGQIALITVPVQANQRLALYVSGSSFGNATAGVFGPDGSAVIAPISISSGTSTGSVKFAAAGYYTIVVAPASGQTGSSTLSLLADVGGTIAVDGSAVSLTNVAGQNMSLTFSGTANQRITLTRQVGQGNIDTCSNTVLLGIDGTTQLWNNIFCSGYGFSDVIVLPTSGTYTIAFDPTGSSTGTVTFTLQSVPPDVAGTISIDGSSVSLTTTAPGQNMNLTFAGTANQRITLSRQIGSGNLDTCSNTAVIQPDGKTQLWSNIFCSGYGFSDVIVLPISGTYTIFFNPAGSTTGSASFTVQSVPPDTKASASIDGGSVSLTTTAPGQNGYATFSATANQRFTLARQITSGNLDTCSNTSIIEPDGTTQLWSNIFCSSYGFSDLLVAPMAGTYTVFFNPAGNTTGTVGLTLQSVPPDVTTPISIDGGSVSLTTTAPGQNALATFSANANQRVTLARQITSGNLDSCSNTSVIQPDGTTRLYSNSFCSNYGFSDVLVLPVAGTYTVLFDPAGSTTGTVSETLRSVPPDASATITPGGGSIGLTITAPGQNGTLTFAGTAGKRVSLLSQFDSGLSANCDNLSIVQPDGSTNLYNPLICSSSDFTGALPNQRPITASVPTLPVTGNYQVQFNPGGTGTGTATFTLYDVPPDAAGSTTPGAAAANYTTTTPGQAVRTTFSGSANGSATVNVSIVNSAQSSCFNVTVVEPDGTTALRGDLSCGSTYTSGSLNLPTSGTYTIVVSPGGTMTGTFSIGVTTP